MFAYSVLIILILL